MQLALATPLALALFSALAPAQQDRLSSTLRDFQQPGSQPEEVSDPVLAYGSCMPCHGNYDPDIEPGRTWSSSLMAQATRDPIFHAAMAIAEQDAAFAGDLCLRCHSPVGWMGGRSVPTDGSALDSSQGDYEGVSCNFCHRMVDPVYEPGNPSEDSSILANLLAPLEKEAHTGQFVLDPLDRRRGPFDLGPSFFWHEWRESSFHRESLLCASCHDVSNPLFERQPDGSYAMGQLDRPHPTQEKRDEFPVERTYSEWAESIYAQGELEMGGRFGGNKTSVSTCQDCHMPDASGTACRPNLGGAFRNDLPLHTMNGANSWVLRAVDHLYPAFETQLTPEAIDDAIARNVSMLQRSADLQLHGGAGEDLVVRVINRTGHKLPTGYGEGRRMWLTVRFLDEEGEVLAEHGAYDLDAAELDEGSTRVWEVVHGLDQAVSEETGVPAGPSFHFVLNNTTLLDNRIPPRGFDDLDFDVRQAGPVGVAYPEQHFWDEVEFSPPARAIRAEVELYHQTTSKEYVEFLRDANVTSDAGDVAHDMWELFGRSEPVLLGSAELLLDVATCPEPIEYGLASSGPSTPEIGWVGTPSAAAGSFRLTLTGARPGSFVGLLQGEAAMEQTLDGAQLLVDGAQVLRGMLTDASGAATVDLPLTPDLAGERRYFQFVYRDPDAPDGLGASAGLHVEFCE